MFSDGENTYRDDDNDDRRSGGSGAGTFILFLLFFFPAWLTGFFVFQLLRVIRLKPSMITLFCAAVLGTIAGSWYFMDFNERFSRYFSLEGAASITSTWTDLIAPVLSVYIALGVIGGWVYTLWQAREIKKKPELLSFTGYWTHNFEYRRTPLEVWKKKKKIEGLKDGRFRGDGEAPLGIDETSESVVSRYNDESVLHTVITGGTGSGKALHGSTLVHVKDRGFIRVRDIKVGDILFDENGDDAEVLEVFQPKAEGHYKVTFSDSTEVKTCADHLWAVTDFRGSETVLNTQQLHDKAADGSGGYAQKFAVKALSAPIESTEHGTVQKRIDTISAACAKNTVHMKNGEVKLFSKNESLLEGLAETISSLGWICYQENGRICFYPEVNVLEDSDAAALAKHFSLNEARNTQREIVSIESIDDDADDYFCFTVDSPNNLFLITKSYIPTHNTISMLSLIKADIAAGRPVFVLDMKRSPDLASKLAKWVSEYQEEHNSEFYHFVNGDPESYDIPLSPGQAFYDPLKSGSATSKADMILGMREYDNASAVYKAAMTRLLQVLFLMTETIRKIRLKTGDTDLCSSIDWDNGGVYQLSSASKTDNFIELLTASMNSEYITDERIPSMAKELLAEVSKKSSQLSHALGELQGQTQTIIASEYGEWMKTAPGERSIDLFEASRTPGSVVLFSLNSDDEKEFARFVGSIIMADVTRVSALRRNKDIQNLMNVYIDEFQILVPDSVTDLLEKSRASAMGITLAQQSLSQVIKGVAGDGEAYLQSILDTCSNFIFHYGSGFETAERMSKIVGKHEVEKYSINKKDDRFIFSLNWKNRRQLLVNTSKEDKWIVEPSEFMNLSSPSESNGYRSTAIIIKKSSSDPSFRSVRGASARETWMIPDKEILEKTYHPTNEVTRRIYDERHEELSDYELLPTSVISGGMGNDVAADIEMHLQKKKLSHLRGMSRLQTGGDEEELNEHVAERSQTRQAPARTTPKKRTAMPAPAAAPARRASSSEGFSQTDPVDVEIEEDEWSLEDLMEDDEPDVAPARPQKPRQAPAPKKPNRPRGGGLPSPEKLSAPPVANSRSGSPQLRKKIQQGKTRPSKGLPKPTDL